jgi:hypothetical protein
LNKILKKKEKTKKYLKLIKKESLKIMNAYKVKMQLNFQDFRNQDLIFEFDDNKTLKEEIKVEKEIQINTNKNLIEIFFKDSVLMNGSPYFGVGNKFGEFGLIIEENSKNKEEDIENIFINYLNEKHLSTRKTTLNFSKIF